MNEHNNVWTDKTQLALNEMLSFHQRRVLREKQAPPAIDPKPAQFLIFQGRRVDTGAPSPGCLPGQCPRSRAA